MKKLFTATLVAVAVAGSFAANAATVSSTPLEFSKEGVAAGFTETSSDLVVDIVVNENHPASSWITLDFGANADLSGIDFNAGVVNNTPGTGEGVAGDITFSYGTGSFTFDNVELVGETGEETGIKFQVNLGNQLSAGSAFRVTISDATALELKGAGSMAYTSTDVTETTTIETGTGIWGIEKNQFAGSVENLYDNRIERVNQVAFAKFDATETNAKDTATFKLTNDTALLAGVTLVSYSVTIPGTYTGYDAADFAAADSAATPNAITLTGAAVNADEDELSFGVLLANVSGDDTYNLTFTADGTTKIPTSDFEISVVANYNNQAGDATTTDLISEADFGEWALDASVVNVPYLPVGFENISANVEYSNHHATKAAAVSITAFDQNGEKYEGTLADAAAMTVTKYSEDDIKAALGITGSAKLNITFISDADVEDVSIVPYYRQGDSRVQTINDQYKGIE